MTAIRENSTKQFQELISILGEKYIGDSVESPFDFITIASSGVNAKVISNFRSHFNISKEQTAEFLNVSEATIYRWLRADKKLERNYSIQLLELTDLFLFGKGVFESQTNFFKWLELPNIALGGLIPRKLLDMPGGIDKVRNLLGRIEYGVYS